MGVLYRWNPTTLQYDTLSGPPGPEGAKGWSPQFATVTDGTRRVLQVSGWTGGQGTAPATGSYVGATGLVAAIADGIDIRGPQGAAGSPGATGPAGGSPNVTSPTGAVTLATFPAVALANATTAAFTVTLPDPHAAGTEVTVKKTDASTNAVTVSRGGTTALIDGATTFVLNQRYASVSLVSDGTNWHVT